MRRLAKGLVAVSAVAVLGVVGAGCLTRPVTHQDPTTKTNFTAVVKQQAVDKIDMLFMIDNSASMGDKQDYLKQAIPDLITRLLQPNCVDDAGKPVGAIADAQGNCANGHPEFPAVHNLHVGVITSSLGPRGGDVCDPTAKAGNLSRHNDDKGELINRGGDDEHPVADMSASNFLAWFPNIPANQNKSPGPNATAITDSKKFQADFQDLIAGTHQLGCGIESQLESWYRFLVQPDPYDSIDSSSGNAKWVGVDQTIIQQRHDFLRPDSLVAIVDLSDENDSEIDVRALGGQAYLWLRSDFTPPRGTGACLTNPADPACTSCQINGSDPNCSKGNYTAQNDWGYNLNVRHVHMKEKYGLDVQFPIERYVRGLTQQQVPNRDGEYPGGASNYVGNQNCTNPLFATDLPDGKVTDPKALCQLRRGPRTKDLIFYAHIGGVPYQLLHFTPGDPTKSALTDADWQLILGKDPQHYDYTGIDPHMIESYKDRSAAPVPQGGFPVKPPSDNGAGSDPISGRDWKTDAVVANGVDREYACTFQLPKPRNCADPAYAEICDCPSAAGVPHDQVPSVCDPNDITKQTHAKTYPTIREILLARLMGAQGILSSMCPIHVTEQGAGDPLYGYRPAVAAIIDRLKNALANQCLPQPLIPDSSGKVPCLILEVMPDSATKCDPAAGLKNPDPAILQKFRDNLKQQYGGDGGADDPSTHTICEVTQLTGGDLVNGSCIKSSKAGWCYVQGAAAGTCPQAILFSPSGNPVNGAQISLQCIEQQGGSSDAGSATD